MISHNWIEKLITSRKLVATNQGYQFSPHQAEAEGGCGVIGIACNEKIRGGHLLQSLIQMRNRGNGKGGGIAAVGLVPEELGVTSELITRDYMLTIAYLDPSSQPEVERNYIEPAFEIDHIHHVPGISDFSVIPDITIKPPEVYIYFVHVKAEALQRFSTSNNPGSGEVPAAVLPSLADEIVYQNTYRLNREFYTGAGGNRAFVLSHGKNMLVLKMVGYADDLVRYYQLEDMHAHVWIGHHRYPTKGKVWHPGGAHPFVGLHEALVHNGDFANYASISEYLAQRNIHPLFLTDTEVSVLVFDLLHRTYGYPLEYVIESLAPTTERDFTLLPREKQYIYQMLQNVHMHGSPDGPWFFLIAHSSQSEQTYRLIGITDTSMLRPQVFALQEGSVSIGFAASEKQAIDAALESMAAEDQRFWTCADIYWNARGGSHTDGGAFIFAVQPNGDNMKLVCTDKFGRSITIDKQKTPYEGRKLTDSHHSRCSPLPVGDVSATELAGQAVTQIKVWDYDDVAAFLIELERSVNTDYNCQRAIETLSLLIDRKYPTGKLRRSSLTSLFHKSLANIMDTIRQSNFKDYVFIEAGGVLPSNVCKEQTVIIDARNFTQDGEGSLALQIVQLHKKGFQRFIIVNARGHRFISNGLGPNSHGIHIDIFGSSGDYLASGIDGTEIIVHGNAQDQLAQIMKEGRLVVYGDVGQTFMYAAKGGKAFVLGNAAGRPLINAVGKPRVVINGTCLDYLAESFMAGDPLNGGGFVILNGISFDDGEIIDLETPYPGGNLFSLASGGAVYIRDPHRKVSEDQLNGGEFTDISERDWAIIKPYLEENEQLFAIPVSRLLKVEGEVLSPEDVYRKVQPRKVRALQAEEAWITERDS